MLFRLIPLAFEFEALDPIDFPSGKLTNILRGALGLHLRKQSCPPECQDSRSCPLPPNQPCLYRQLFEGERGDSRPSGYREPPRPFVFRSAHWQKLSLAPHQTLSTELNLFDLRPEILTAILSAHSQMGTQGLGPGCGRLRLRKILQPVGSHRILWQSGSASSLARPGAITFDLATPHASAPHRIQAEFLTPTEFKSAGVISHNASFDQLFRRLHERISFLIAHYDSGDFSAAPTTLLHAASKITTLHQQLRPVELQRYSTRTHQSHPLSGFVGRAEYEGDFSHLWPWLQASEWAGIGRQTVWGKGHVRWSATSQMLP